MLKREWKKLLKNKMLLLVIGAVILIPTIYTTLFLGSMWDPYGKLEELPVAVVNKDKPVTYQKDELMVGNELVDKLKNEDSLSFHFVDQESGERGLKNGTYYMVITIPENFSKNASTLLDEKPQKMILEYQTNPGTNYIASKMSETAMEKIKNSVADEVTKTYTEAVFNQIKDAGDGMQQAADGSGQLEEGTGQLLLGNKEITDNLKTLADSSLIFEDGSRTLEKGLKAYTDGVSTAKEGAEQLAEGNNALDGGVKQLQEKLPELSGGAVQLSDGLRILADGSGAAYAGSEQLKAGATQVDENLQVLNTGLGQLKEQTAALPEATEHLAEGAAELAAGAGLLENGMEQAAEGAAGLQAGNEQISMGLGALDADSQNLLDGLDGLKDGILQVMDKEGNLATDGAVSAQDLQVMIETAFSEYKSRLQEYTDGVKNARHGSDAMLAGFNGTEESQGLSEGIQNLRAGTENLQRGLEQIKEGTSQLAEKAPLLAQGTAQAAEGGLKLQQSGTTVLKEGSNALNQGLLQVSSGSLALKEGGDSLVNALPELTDGVSQLSSGSERVKGGSGSLAVGMEELADNSQALLAGASQLENGASQMGYGSGQLYDGSQELGDGINQITDGANTLNSSLADGAAQARSTKKDDRTVDMFASPVIDRETQITSVENNGHAMAPYMMSVALWVGCIAFSLMYPLTKYEGKLSSGFSWWLSKASVLYLVAILQALVMVFLLYKFDGFTPVRMGETTAVACLASVAFMSVMYFFTNSFGKAGSFLMLIFMVIQLAGSVGTYPLELSGTFVKYLHGWVPFTYTVEAFRSAVSGGESIERAVIYLTILWSVFSLLTVGEFALRARKIKAGKPVLENWLEQKGLA